MKHLFNLSKYIFYIFLSLFLSCQDNLTDPVQCADYDLFEDECGQCTQCDESCDCDLEECDWSLSKDSCGVCFGDNTSCIGCMSENATNYNSEATIPCDNCCVYSNLFIVYSDENGFEPNLHQTNINVPVYWLNNSNHEITIKTVNTTQPECIIDQSSIYNNNECLSYETSNICEDLNNGCLWEIPLSHDQSWDNFEVTIPAFTGTNSQSQYYFFGFGYPAGYQYFYESDDGNIQYGFINVTSN